MRLIAKASIQIQKPPDEVFEGIVSDAAMTKYFISESSGRMEAGNALIWKFAEFPDAFPVRVERVEKDRMVSFVWEEGTVVEIRLEAQTDGSTVVRVTEDGKPYSDDSLKWVIGNTEGWANFLACLKAWLEYGICLRQGAFDFMRLAG